MNGGSIELMTGRWAGGAGQGETETGAFLRRLFKVFHVLCNLLRFSINSILIISFSYA